jgi:hypothetical protein
LEHDTFCAADYQKTGNMISNGERPASRGDRGERFNRPLSTSPQLGGGARPSRIFSAVNRTSNVGRGAY